MKKYLALVRKITSGFKQIQFEKVPRSQNMLANPLSKLSAREPIEGMWMESFKEKAK